MGKERVRLRQKHAVRRHTGSKLLGLYVPNGRGRRGWLVVEGWLVEGGGYSSDASVELICMFCFVFPFCQRVTSVSHPRGKVIRRRRMHNVKHNHNTHNLGKHVTIHARHCSNTQTHTRPQTCAHSRADAHTHGTKSKASNVTREA